MERKTEENYTGGGVYKSHKYHPEGEEPNRRWGWSRTTHSKLPPCMAWLLYIYVDIAPMHSNWHGRHTNNFLKNWFG